MAEFTDADLFEELQRGPPVASATMLADNLGVTRQAVHQRLQKLHDSGQVDRVDLGRDIGWFASQGKQEVRHNDFIAGVRHGDGFVVDIDDQQNNATLHVQAGPKGYQLDLWWVTDEGERRESNNWVHLIDGEREQDDYPHDNRHNRQPALTTSHNGINIHDPDPRAPSVGYEGASIEITRVENALHARLKWVDEYDESHEDIALIPFADPRYDHDEYYSIIA